VRRLAWAASLVASAAILAQGAPGGTVDHADLDAILRAIVRGESVDYGALGRHHLAPLDAYLTRIAAIDPEPLPRGERIALYLNAYNATVLCAVAQRYKPGYRPDADSFRLFDEPLVRLHGKTMSLNDLEHRELRSHFDEPRVHAALVCAARSCPPLLPRAYTGADLDRTLDENMRRFVRDPARNEIDLAARTLRLSRIFEWYIRDFGGPERLAAYVERYAGRDVAGFAVEFLPYSWELNDVVGSGAPAAAGPSAPAR